MDAWEDAPQPTPHDMQRAAEELHESALFGTLVDTFEEMLPVFAAMFTRRCGGVLEAFLQAAGPAAGEGPPTGPAGTASRQKRVPW